MNCPFLKEAHVRTCAVAPVRKMLVEAPDLNLAGVCGSDAHTGCRVFQSRGEDGGQGACPYLDEQLVQYCSVAPVKKYIPYSESVMSRCGGNNYQYCSLYLALSQPGYAHQTAGDSRDPLVEGIRVPRKLYYAPNHMWLNIGDNGSCHVGLDGFLSRLLGNLERISFVAAKGVRRPSVALTVEGMTWPLIFPNDILISNANLYLRSDPARLAADPYGAGWLYEGWEAPGQHAHDGLMTGDQAAEWMAQEMERLGCYVHNFVAGSQSELGAVLNDGGVPDAGLLNHLPPDELARLFNEFFSPQASWKIA